MGGRIAKVRHRLDIGFGVYWGVRATAGYILGKILDGAGMPIAETLEASLPAQLQGS